MLGCVWRIYNIHNNGHVLGSHGLNCAAQGSSQAKSEAGCHRFGQKTNKQSFSLKFLKKERKGN